MKFPGPCSLQGNNLLGGRLGGGKRNLGRGKLIEQGFKQTQGGVPDKLVAGVSGGMKATVLGGRWIITHTGAEVL